MRSVSIIGVGRVGGSLGIALSRAGFRLAQLVGRNTEGLEKIAETIEPVPKLLVFGEAALEPVDILFICTRDPEIQDTADLIAREIKNRPVVFHTSGSLSSNVLAALAEIGCPTGSLHPLVSISDPIRGSANFSGANFCIEGDKRAIQTAELIVRALGGSHFSIGSEKKALYHAAAVMASGNVTAVFDSAIEMMKCCGVERDEGRQILLHLLVSTVENLKVQDTGDALTGSFARADFEAFERHWKSLRQYAEPRIQRIFVELGERSLEIAERKGSELAGAAKLREMINMAKGELEC